MKKVLLATEGLSPSARALKYGIQFCRWIKAELHVLQVFTSEGSARHFRKLKEGAKGARRYVEDSMLAVTFAEAGEHETAKDLMTQTGEAQGHCPAPEGQASVPCRVTVRYGRPDQEIIEYVRNDPGVVLTICDIPEAEVRQDRPLGSEDNPFERLEKELPVPLVVFRSGGLLKREMNRTPSKA